MEKDTEQSATPPIPFPDLLDRLTTGVVTLNRAWRYTYINRRAEAIIGQPRDTLLGRGIWDIFADAVDTPSYTAYHRALETGKPQSVVVYYPRFQAWFEACATPQPEGLLIEFDDVSERLRLAEHLRVSEANFRPIFEQAAIGIGMVGLDGAWLDVNQRLCEIVGYTRDELTRRTFQQLTYPPDLGADLALADQLLAGAIPTYTIEKRYIRKSGDLIWTNLTVALVRDAEGRPSYFISVIEDIAARKAAEEALRELTATLEQRVQERTAELEATNARLERANRDLDAFSFSVAHDLRAPLRGIERFASILATDEGQRLSAEGRHYTSRIVAAASRMDRLIQDVLEYGRVGRGETTLHRVELDVVTRRALAIHTDAIQQTQARVEMVEPLHWVLGAMGLLTQVIGNLVENALLYVAPGQRPDIRIYAERRAAADGAWRVRLWIADTGIGIAPERQERVFRPFERLHGEETYPGSGIGLAIVQRGVERMGGSVGVESQPGKGSRFWIELPEAEPYASAPAAQEGTDERRAMAPETREP